MARRYRDALRIDDNCEVTYRGAMARGLSPGADEEREHR